MMMTMMMMKQYNAIVHIILEDNIMQLSLSYRNNFQKQGIKNSLSRELWCRVMECLLCTYT